MLSMSLCQLRLGSCHVDQLAWHTMARKHVAACSMVNNVALARCHMWPGVRAHSHARHHALSELPPHTRDALKAVQLLSTRLGPSQEERELVEKLQGAVWKVSAPPGAHASWGCMCGTPSPMIVVQNVYKTYMLAQTTLLPTCCRSKWTALLGKEHSCQAATLIL